MEPMPWEAKFTPPALVLPSAARSAALPAGLFWGTTSTSEDETRGVTGTKSLSGS